MLKLHCFVNRTDGSLTTEETSSGRSMALNVYFLQIDKRNQSHPDIIAPEQLAAEELNPSCWGRVFDRNGSKLWNAMRKTDLSSSTTMSGPQLSC